MSVEDFGSTPDAFDFDAWLDQGGRPERTVNVYSAWQLGAELARIEKAIEIAEQEEDPSVGDVGPDELREQWQAVASELEASGKPFTIRSLTNEEVVTVTAGVPDVEVSYRDQHGEVQTRWKPDRIAVGDALLAEALVSPKLDRNQVTALRRKLGDGPVQILFDTVADLRAAGGEFPTIPFSGASSDDSQE